MTESKCDRCSYDEVDPTESVPEFFQDRYQSICAHCARELERLQARHDNQD